VRPGAEKTGAIDDVGFILQQRCEKQWVFVRVIFEVGILDDDEIAGRFRNAAAQGRSLTHVFWLEKDTNLGMALAEFDEELARTILRAVIRADQFKVEGHGQYPVDHLAQCGTFVVHGHDHGEFHGVIQPQ
jgi:hypothetical protein